MIKEKKGEPRAAARQSSNDNNDACFMTLIVIYAN